MHFKPFDRLPIIEWAGWWDQTISRWLCEGLPASVSDRYDLYQFFGLDMYYQDWLPVHKPGFPYPSEFGAGVITNDREYDTVRQYLFPATAIDTSRWERWAESQQRGESVLWFSLDGFFWFPRTLLGIEPHLFSFYDQPELLHRINADLSDWMLTVIDQLCRVCTPDFMTFGEDMSYNHGPMISKDLFDEFMLPYYRRVIPELSRRGILTIIDSDGDVTVPASWFEAAGLQGILPLERQAGVDINRLRADHPAMRFIGHFDKMVMNKGEKAMRGEFERLLPAAAQGGFLISCDHQTPPGVSLEQYQLYLSLFREYAEEAGRQSKNG